MKDLPAGASAYDNAGNQRDVAPYTLTYDAENRVVSATSAVNGNATYAYDGEGRRVRSVVGSVTTTFVYDASGQLAAEYATQPVAASGVRYLFADHLGSTRVTTKGGTATGDGTNLVVSRQDYLPYGETLATASRTVGLGSGGAGERTQFTGHLRDQETGLDYMEARYFAGVQGRFLSSDAPLADQDYGDPQSWNLFSYVRNNPLRNVDPSGRDCVGTVLGDHSAESCVDQLIGGAKVVGNVPSDTLNSPNRLFNLLMSPFTDFRFPDVIPTTFQASNGDQAQGMEAMQVVLAATPYVEALAGRVAEALSIGGKVEAAGVELSRPYIRKSVRREVEAAAPRTADGKFIDPNTGTVIQGKYDLGHKPGHEFRREKARAEAEGLTQKQFNDRMNDSRKYQIESPSSNRSRRYERKP